MYRSTQSYSLYDTIMRNRRSNRRAGVSPTGVPTTQTLTDKAVGGTRLPGPGAVRQATTGPTYSDFVGRTDFATGPEGSVFSLAENPELRRMEGVERLTSGQAATQTRTGYFGPLDPDTGMGKFGYGVTQALSPAPFLGDLMGGTTTVDPYGKTVTIPLGTLGAAARKNIEKQYEIAEYIQQGKAGYHQFYSGGQLVSIVPQNNPLTGKPVGYTALGTFSGSPQGVLDQYAAMYGYDPASVDFGKRPGQRGFGIELESFVPGTGGFTRNGEFVDVLGRTETNPSDYKAQLGLINDVYGADQAINQLSKMNLSDDVKSTLMDSIQQGAMTAEQVIDSDGNVVGFNTGTGSVVRSGDNSIVTSGDGKTPVTSGTGILSYESYDAIRNQVESEASDSGQGMGEGVVSGFTTVSGDGKDRDSGSSRSSTSQAAASEDAYDPSDTFFAEGGFVNRKPMQEGGEAPVVAEAGFIGKEPETLPEGMTVADDVPVDVPEGTFVINAAAVEFMGSADVKKMILEAIAEAERQGIDISQKDDTIPKEELVSLVVSRGEVIVPPALAKIIGYDRLNKINNRGKAEVERRVEENGQADQPADKPEILQQAYDGGVQTNEYDMYAKSVLDVVEGAKDEPHVPTSNSGVTIGRGVDLARFLPEEMARAGIDDETIEKLRPFLATGMGKYGPRGSRAEAQKGSLNLTPDEIQNVSDSIYEYKKARFDKDFPQFKDALPKDKAMAFSAYYVAGKKGMDERYVTFLNTYKKTGDIIKSMDEGFLKILKPGDTEYNRALNALNWYFTADDADLASQGSTSQERYTKGMIEAFRRKDELEGAPAGFIPPESRGTI